MNRPFDFGELDITRPLRRRQRSSPAIGWTMLAVMLAGLIVFGCFWPAGVLVFLVGYIGGMAWAAVDSRGEPTSPVWIILIFLAGPIGLLVYLIQRPG